ncbi:hypothetical protein M758_UG129700 [Ceratodon purpureus]|nr:hypothetical protein M758_UG129700 [Ceratodon purpureus]
MFRLGSSRHLNTGGDATRHITNVYNSGVRALSIRGSGSFKLYTPLQLWEYENRLPIDGVTNVSKWAVKVSLADEETKGSLPRKKIKETLFKEPRKYGESTVRVLEESEVTEQMAIVETRTPLKSCTSGINDEEKVEEVCKGKGKEPMEEQ